ncbi:MAG TPA: bifunctional phosphoglucose/phosphomannose isomerase [Dehalococcoidales bacterium]|nr:bifunctional phosphoglucose/phosphomannose isomerase [Dehalococcoidales bacterium]
MQEKHIAYLDNPEIYQKYDPSGMLIHIHNFPRLCRDAWQMGLGIQLPEEYKAVKKVLILGMGGSAIGGDLMASLAVNESAVTVQVCREYFLPRHVDQNTLVIASSYSGMTEETLSAFEQSFETSALKLAVTTGGKLQSLCQSRDVPVFTINYKSSPRAALPYSFFTLMGIMQNLGFLPERKADFEETFSLLDQMNLQIAENTPQNENPAKMLAQKLMGRLPVIYGSGITSEVARRWKGQINENSKMVCFFEVYPELNHNAVMGYRFPEVILAKCFIVMLDSTLLHERVQLRYEITGQILDKAGIQYQVVKGRGNSALSQMMSLVLFGDYVSYYLAMLNQTDPTEIKAIDFLKNSLAKH